MPLGECMLKSTPAGVSNVSEYAKTTNCWSRVSGSAIPFDLDVLKATVSIGEAKERARDAREVGVIDMEIAFDQLVVENMAQIIASESVALRRRLLSPLSSRAISKLKRGNINLTPSERNALKYLLTRLDEFGAGPSSWKK